VTETTVNAGQRPQRKLRVGVLFGGRSGEHEVSLISARGVMQAIDKDKYEVVPIGVTKEGRWIMDGDPLYLLCQAAESSGRLGDAEPATEMAPTLQVALVPRAGVSNSNASLQNLDVIFPVLHGPFGEDGTVQGFLELAGLPYVGASVMTSAVGMDKAASKAVFSAQGLPILPYRVFLRKTWEAHPAQVVTDCEATFSYPTFTKPANLGSSVGVTKAHQRSELIAGLAEAARFDRKLIVEQGIQAREIELSVLGNDDPIVSVPGEIIPSREFYSYAAKYLDNASQLLIPAPLTVEQTRWVQQLALRAFTALDGAGMARVDFLMDKATGEIWLNELNTIPGFTPISMYPKLWEASGIGYTELIDRLIQLAIERSEDKGRSATSFDVAQAT
jgi:D-alanine-D-alanine ligase